jgi:hypothetical protein
MLLWEFMEMEIYKTAKYIKLVDEDGIALQPEKFFKKVAMLNYKELADNGVEIKLWVCNAIPVGWKIKFVAMFAPKGFYWICNGKSIFSTKYKKALLRGKQ